MSKQFTIIDGYNLLHVAGFLNLRSQQRAGPGTLEKARNRLFGILARDLDLGTRTRTTIVFDSAETGLPNRMTTHDMLVEFANLYENADELIKALIRQHSVPKNLTVVSSDHEIQRAANARGATAIDSDVWLDTIAADLANRPVKAPSEKPADDRNDVDIGFWKKELGIDDLEFNLQEDDESPTDDRRTGRSRKRTDHTGKTDDVFPPGYADDLWDDDQDPA